jgi:hypothetical protein
VINEGKLRKCRKEDKRENMESICYAILIHLGDAVALMRQRMRVENYR